MLCIHTATQHSDEFMTENPTCAIFVTAPHFLLPAAQRQLKALLCIRQSPLLWGSLAVPQWWPMRRLMLDLLPGFTTQRIPEPLWQQAGAGEKGNAQNSSKAESSFFPKCCWGCSVQGKQCQPSAGKPTWNPQLTAPAEMRSTTRQRNGQSLLAFSAGWYMEAELGWNFNNSCNSPQIIITSFIEVKSSTLSPLQGQKGYGWGYAISFFNPLGWPTLWRISGYCSQVSLLPTWSSIKPSSL